MPKAINLPVIRKIKPQENKQIQNIVEALPTQAGFNWPQVKLLDELRAVETWAAFEGAKIRAFVSFRILPEALEISILATHPRHQRGGWMRSLLQHLFDAKGQSVWWLEVHEANEAAINLYKQLGFKVSGERSRYYNDGGKAYLMSRP